MTKSALCNCGRDYYDADKYWTCYTCFLDRRQHYLTCIWCGRWHSPDFPTCFVCGGPNSPRAEAARNLRQYVLWRDDYRCVACGDTVNLQVDHIRPCRMGGRADPWNLQTLCGECNRFKGGMWIPGSRWPRRRRDLLVQYFYWWRSLLDAEQRRALRRDVKLLRCGGDW